MKTKYRKRLSLFLTFVLSAAVPAAAFPAGESDAAGTVTGTYHFTSTKAANAQIEDSFVFREDCFERSSFLGCTHLAELSCQAALASASWYGSELDPFEISYAENSHNLVQMLEDMGFSDIRENAYYSLEKEDNSMAAVAARRTIEVSGKTYTLLAVIPRSDGYKQEWVGNFTIGDGGIHEGFLAARDEILRFVRQYIREQHITGDLKLWTAGHSRGAAAADLVAAFFAGGGISYFGDTVSITPEDVYCYSFAAPRMVMEGASKAAELSVSGARGGVYAADTPQEAWVSSAEGTLDPGDPVYGGIRNYPLDYDLITLLPPAAWGYTWYGSVCPLDGGGLITTEDMLDMLKDLRPSAYRKFTEGIGPDDFAWAVFDVPSLEISAAGSPPEGGVDAFLDQRVLGMSKAIPSGTFYAESAYQEALRAVGGLYGLLMNNMKGTLGDSLPDLAGGAALSYLAYACERLIEEGKAETETEAAALAVKDLMLYLNGVEDGQTESGPEAFTFDDFVLLAARFIADSEGSPLTDRLVSAVNRYLSGNSASFMIRLTTSAFYPGFTPSVPVTDGELFLAFLKACVYGPSPECAAAQTYPDAAAVRRTLYSLASMAIRRLSPEIIDAIGKNAEGQADGSGLFADFLAVLTRTFLQGSEKKGSADEDSSSLSFGKAADALLRAGADGVFRRAIASAEELYGAKYRDDALAWLGIFEENISCVREFLSCTLFYTEGEPFSTGQNVLNACTFIRNRDIFLESHACEIYLAWAKALNRQNGSVHGAVPE